MGQVNASCKGASYTNTSPNEGEGSEDWNRRKLQNKINKTMSDTWVGDGEERLGENLSNDSVIKLNKTKRQGTFDGCMVWKRNWSVTVWVPSCLLENENGKPTSCGPLRGARDRQTVCRSVTAEGITCRNKLVNDKRKVLRIVHRWLLNEFVLSRFLPRWKENEC